MAPKLLRPDKDAETMLINFVKTIKSFFIATGKNLANNRQKIALQQMGQGSQKFCNWHKEVYKQAEV